MSQQDKKAQRKKREEDLANALRENLKRRRGQKQERESHDNDKDKRTD